MGRHDWDKEVNFDYKKERMDTVQKRVDDWIRNYGVRYFDEKTNTILLMEEVGEFSRHIARIYGEQNYKSELTDETKKAKLGEELADILFVTVCLANQIGINLQDALDDSFRKKTNRDHDRHKNNKKLQ